MSHPIAEALRETLESPNVRDSNGEWANVVDVLQQVAWSISKLADAVHVHGVANPDCVHSTHAHD